MDSTYLSIANNLMKARWGPSWDEVHDAASFRDRIAEAIKSAVEEACIQTEMHVMGRMEDKPIPGQLRCVDCRWFDRPAESLAVGMGLCVLHNGRKQAATRRLKFSGTLCVDECFSCVDFERRKP